MFPTVRSGEYRHSGEGGRHRAQGRLPPGKKMWRGPERVGSQRPRRTSCECIEWGGGREADQVLSEQLCVERGGHRATGEQLSKRGRG
jgi:hypothetical protein